MKNVLAVVGRCIKSVVEKYVEEMKMTNNKRDHFVKSEGIAFEEFVGKALSRKCDVIDNSLTRLFLPNGLPGISELPCYVEIQYGNNENLIYDVIESCKLRPLMIIYLGDIPFLKKDENVFILGASYVKALAVNNPDLWWNFISSCNECPEVRINETDKTLYIEWLPLAVLRIGVNAELYLNQISGLSKFNAEDFRRRAQDNPQNVSIIVGNGVSIPFGSDLWGQLSDYMFDYLSPKYVDNGTLVKKSYR